MKLCEEFKLYENMWDDESSVDSAELSDTIITALTKAFRRNDNVLIEAPFNANAVGICEKWVSDKGRSMTRLSVMTETESELEIKLKQAYSRKHIVLLEDVERLKPRVLSKLFAIICEEGSTEFTICVVVKALPFSSWNSRVFPVVVHGFTDEAIDESVNTDKPYKLSCTGSDLDDAITLNKVPAYLKNVKEVELVDRDRVPVKKYNQICKMLADLGIKVTKGASGRETSSKLKESRSVADIEAEIARLQQELEQAKIAEKKASYGVNLPKTVWTWDIYLEPTEKGTWTGIENDLVFETEDKALDAAWELLNELDDEGELDGDPDDYYVEAFEVPLSSVSASTLKFNKLAHLI